MLEQDTNTLELNYRTAKTKKKQKKNKKMNGCGVFCFVSIRVEATYLIYLRFGEPFSRLFLSCLLLSFSFFLRCFSLMPETNLYTTNPKHKDSNKLSDKSILQQNFEFTYR